MEKQNFDENFDWDLAKKIVLQFRADILKREVNNLVNQQKENENYLGNQEKPQENNNEMGKC